MSLAVREADQREQFLVRSCARLRRDGDMEQLRAAVAAGELAADADLDLIEDAVWAALHGTTSLTISRRLTVGIPGAGPAEMLAAATRTADMLVNALIDAARA